MNYIWSAMIVLSLLFSLFCGTAEQTLNAGINAARGSVEVLLSFAGIMCMWSGILRLCECGGISGAIKKALSPVLNLLFKNLKDESAKGLITMNITANLLGMGNAATPAGTAAMQRLDELNGGSPYPSAEMCVFAVLNTSALSLVPSTVIAILGGGGLENASRIIIPVWIVSLLSLCAALTAVKLLCRR
jgi:spore maturation protein A